MKQTPDRRHFSRISFDGQCTIFFQEQTYQAQLVDICLSGVLVHADNVSNIDFEPTANISIDLQDSQTSIEIEVTLVKRDDDFLHFKINHIDIESTSHLRRLLELNLGDASLLERELHELAQGKLH
jgi:hypothetical protein